MGDSSDQNSVGKNKQLLRPPPGFELKINDNLPMSSREKIQVDTNFTPGYVIKKKITAFEITVFIVCKFAGAVSN